MAGPLTGIRVLDLSRVLAGPWCTQILADMGADVIKIERPGSGDETRHWGPPWLADQEGRDTSQSAYFVAVNRGKHSVAVDLSRAEGVSLVRQFVARADVLVENFKVGDLASRGLGYPDCATINPGLIYCSITGFGQTGPMAELPGYDYLVQAQGGLMSITGNPEGTPGAGPQRVGVAVSDLTTGMNAAIAILAALHHRCQTGEGQQIDLALLDVQVSWLANQAQNYLCSGKVPACTGAWHPNLAPYQPFETRDDMLIVAIGNDSQFARLCDVLDLRDLVSDIRFASNPARVSNREALAAILQGALRLKTSDEWMSLFRSHKLPCGPIQSIAEVFEDPQVLARNMLVDIEHPVLGPVRTVSNPINFSSTLVEYRKAPPTLGEDTYEVLSKVLGMDTQAIEALKAGGTIT